MHEEIKNLDAKINMSQVPFDMEDVNHLRDAISWLCTNGCTAVPGLAHVHNKVAARLDAPLLDGAEDLAD